MSLVRTNGQGETREPFGIIHLATQSLVIASSWQQLIAYAECGEQ
ncbi:MAG TPA: hypothetical protein V6C90_23320 [Coleofasciculaceae cyanobacterium]